MNISSACSVLLAMAVIAPARPAPLPERTAPNTSTAKENRARPGLSVSPNGRYLVRRDGKPFFWLGDTAWLLVQSTTREEAELYLRTRAKQGFTVIQATLVAEWADPDGARQPNRYGDVAFVDGDPARPAITPGKAPGRPDEYDYWDHVDYIVDRAAAHGLTLGLLPLSVGGSPEGYRDLTPDKAYAYGLFLGRRYGAKGNILWILGGDNTPDTKTKQDVWDRMAKGITEGTAGTEDYTRTLMTYHINGGHSSSEWFQTAPWLDLNMCQVWGDEKGIYAAVSRDYAKTPAKPAGLGEGSYEDGPQYPTRPIDAHKIREEAYWSYMAGGYHTYGNTNIWSFGTDKAEMTQDWKAALDSPGARSLSVVKRFFTALPWWELAPDPSVFASGAGSGEDLNTAMRSASGDRVLVYLSRPCTVTLRLDRVSGAKDARATWIDPRTGRRSAAGRYPAAAERAFTTPDGWPDALLLLEARR